jgi:hypothetical protein
VNRWLAPGAKQRGMSTLHPWRQRSPKHSECTISRAHSGARMHPTRLDEAPKTSKAKLVPGSGSPASGHGQHFVFDADAAEAGPVDSGLHAAHNAALQYLAGAMDESGNRLMVAEAGLRQCYNGLVVQQ